MSECLFCKIVSGDVPSKKVYEDEDVVAFRDIDPKAPVHLLLVPRKHLGSLSDVGDADRELMGKILLMTRKLAADEGLAEDGYRVVNNCGVNGGQAVQHLHFHLLGGRRMSWPPG